MLVNFNNGEVFMQFTEGRLTRKRYKMITEELIDLVWGSDTGDAVAEFGDYIIVIDTWQWFSEVHGELEIYRNGNRIFKKVLILAE